ncbi:thioredoxin [Vandammella animalimorsus]|uniref:Thioredoxin n=1 Tax=Vandammella animalimorsus TaxID=2029117 RepID=A0A3M6RJ96_9BURK|nr:thioredoxin [Vandammella animalimorsus]
MASATSWCPTVANEPVAVAAGDGAAAPLRLIGLCAAWCGVCREFEPVFERLRSSHPQAQLAWLDVEEPAVSDALGALDIDTFPTIALGRGQQLLFWGSIVPQATVLSRLLQEGAAMGGQPMRRSSPQPLEQQAWRALQAMLDGAPGKA